MNNYNETTVSQFEYEDYCNFFNDKGEMEFPAHGKCMFCGGDHDGSWCQAIDDSSLMEIEAANFNEL